MGLLTPVIERKATIPVLSKIKMETNIQGELALPATDLDVTMRIRQVADVLQSGSILVEGRKLYDISRELPNEPIHFALNKKRANRDSLQKKDDTSSELSKARNSRKFLFITRRAFAFRR